MTRWFRFHAAVLDNPKVQKLPAEMFKHWVNLLCLAAKGGGFICGPLEDVAFSLRLSEAKAQSVLDALGNTDLILPDGDGWRPKDWNEWQFVSDSSTERVKRFRKRRMKRDETVSETPPYTEADTEQNSVANATGAAAPSMKDLVWKAGLDWLSKHTGKPESKLRSVVGGWMKDYGDARVYEAFQAAFRNTPVEPVSYIEKLLQQNPAKVSGQQSPINLDAIFGPKEAAHG